MHHVCTHAAMLAWGLLLLAAPLVAQLAMPAGDFRAPAIASIPMGGTVPGLRAQIRGGRTVLADGGLLAERLLQYWWVIDSAWLNTTKERYTYDADGRQVRYETQRWIDDAWVNEFSYEYRYDGAGRLSEFFSAAWNAGAWMPYAHWIYTYEVHGWQASYLVQEWQGDAWVNETLDSARYDGSGHPVYTAHYSWGGSTWGKVNKHEFAYDASGRQLWTIEIRFNGLSWINYRQDSTWYDADGHVTFQLGQHWDFDMWQWMNSYRQYYTYDSLGREVSTFRQGINVASWADLEQSFRSYDPRGNCVWTRTDYSGLGGWTLQSEQWYAFDYRALVTLATLHNGPNDAWTRDQYAYDGAGRTTVHTFQKIVQGGWTNQTQEQDAYDADGNITGELHLLWNGTAWGPNYRYLSTWNAPAGVDDERGLPSALRLAENFPNPFNPSTTIQYSIPSAGDVTLSVHDLLGREVAVLFAGKAGSGEHTAVWDASNLPSGVYFCRLSADGAVLAKKMLFLR